VSNRETDVLVLEIILAGVNDERHWNCRPVGDIARYLYEHNVRALPIPVDASRAAAFIQEAEAAAAEINAAQARYREITTRFRAAQAAPRRKDVR
jgi:hypothetical protein